MKSTFLLLVIIGFLVSGQVFAQRKQVGTNAYAKKDLKKAVLPLKPKQTTTTIVESPATPVEAPKSPFDKFYERLSIGYFGSFTSPNFEKWDSRRAALSPEFSGGKNQDSAAMNLWNQVNFGYNFGAKLRFNVIPRFTVFMNKAPDQDPGERGMVLLEDALVGFSGVIYTSENKKFNWWIRPGIRLPTSHATRHTNHSEFGRLNYNLEVVNIWSYDFTPKWQLALTFQDRYWIYEQRYNASRNRLYLAPNFTYTINETTKIQGYYENMLENNRRWMAINGKNPSYRNVWQNAYIGVAKDVTPKLNLYPFLSAFVNDVPFSTQSFWLGIWISYQIK